MKQFTSRLMAGRSRPSYSFVALLAVIACAALAFPAHALGTLPILGFGLATNASNNPTLLDLAKTLDPDGSTAEIIEILNETNEVIEDMTFIEGNLPTGHRTTIRSGIPLPTWRKMYGGVQPNKSTNVQITDTTGMLEAYGEVDKALADLNGNSMAFRAQEDRAHIEGIGETIAGTTFYGNETVTPESFTGLAPRFSSLSAESGDNIIDAGGTGSDNSSIWLVVWGPRTVHGIVPKGSKAGLQTKDLGEVMIQNSDSSKFQAYVTHFRQDAGLCVRDWRYVARVANIDISDLKATVANQKLLINYMIQAAERIPNLGAGRPAFYMNRTVRELLRLGVIAQIAPATLSFENFTGKRVVAFDGIPVRRVDQLLKTEAQVT